MCIFLSVRFYGGSGNRGNRHVSRTAEGEQSSDLYIRLLPRLLPDRTLHVYKGGFAITNKEIFLI